MSAIAQIRKRLEDDKVRPGDTVTVHMSEEFYRRLLGDVLERARARGEGPWTAELVGIRLLFDRDIESEFWVEIIQNGAPRKSTYIDISKDGGLFDRRYGAEHE